MRTYIASLIPLLSTPSTAPTCAEVRRERARLEDRTDAAWNHALNRAERAVSALYPATVAVLAEGLGVAAEPLAVAQALAGQDPRVLVTEFDLEAFEGLARLAGLL